MALEAGPSPALRERENGSMHSLGHSTSLVHHPFLPEISLLQSPGSSLTWLWFSLAHPHPGSEKDPHSSLVNVGAKYFYFVLIGITCRALILCVILRVISNKYRERNLQRLHQVF